MVELIVRPSGLGRHPITLDFPNRAEREDFKPVAQRLSSHDDARLAAQRIHSEKAWSHKNEGTHQTHEFAYRTRQGSVSRLFMMGSITPEQLGWAVEIASVYEQIEGDVSVRVVSYEPRIDCSASARNSLVEGISRVRREIAYGWWRNRIGSPRRAVLDMLTGETKSFRAVERDYRISRRHVRKIFFHALDLWPEAQNYAVNEVDDATLAAAHAGIL